MEELPLSVRLFLEYDYAETRDILRAFLTLVSGTLVFSVAFSEKITKTHQALPRVRRLMFAGWVAFFGALIGGGAALVLIVAAAGCTLYGELPGQIACSAAGLSMGSWATALLAGCAYAGGLMCLAVAARRAIAVDVEGGDV